MRKTQGNKAEPLVRGYGELQAQIACGLSPVCRIQQLLRSYSKQFLCCLLLRLAQSIEIYEAIST
jgi:hypothetical protein